MPALNCRDVRPESARVLQICLRFGVSLEVPAPPSGILGKLDLRLEPRTVSLISGPSGAGKSRLLAEIGARYPTARSVQDVPFPLDVSIVDAVLPTRPAPEAMALLTACGLGEPAVWLRRFGQLSEGERFRARLARSIGLHRRERNPSPLLCDEFCALLHRRLARTIAFNLRKLAWHEKIALVVATSQDDLEVDLAPDRIVRLPLLPADESSERKDTIVCVRPRTTESEEEQRCAPNLFCKSLAN